MDVRCEKCGTEYEFEEARVGPNGVTVRCTNCSFVFKVHRPKAPAPAAARAPRPRPTTTIGKAPQGREWLVRKPDGQMVAFRELTTLQKWIVEGRISRDDEISKNGETWKRLGNILELEPFFTVYEKARTLNEIIERGGDGNKVELRGTELLSTMDPLHAPPAEPVNLPAPSLSSVVHAQLPGDSMIPQPSSQIIDASAPESRRNTPLPAAPAPAPAPVEAKPRSTSQYAILRDEAEPATRELLRNDGPLDGPEFPEVNLAGGDFSGVNTPVPASFTGDLSFSLAEESRDPVASFQRNQRRKSIFWVAGLLILIGGGGGIALALMGPKGNSLQALATKYGLLKADNQQEELSRLLDSAHSEAELDSKANRKKALGYLEKAQKMRPEDGVIMAERALIAVREASVRQRFAVDLEAAAARVQKQEDRWKAEVAAAQKRRKPLPPKPKLNHSVAELKKHAEEQRSQANEYMSKARPLIDAAKAKAPSRMEPARALAAYLLEEGSLEAFAPQLEQLKKAIDKAGRTDGYTLYLEAAAEVSAFGSVETAQIVKAQELLKKALTIRPTLHCARILQARLYLRQGQPEQASRTIAAVLQTSPLHEEALRLKQYIQLNPKPQPPTQAEVAKEKPAAEEKPAVAAAEPAKAKPKASTPRTFEGWMRLGMRLRHRDRINQALNAYGRAAELSPRSAEPMAGKGWCFLDLGRPRLALVAFQNAIRNNERFADAYYGAAEAHRKMGQKAKALQNYRSYMTRAPSRAVERNAAKLQIDKLSAELESAGATP